jgi:hypothetical protein
MDQSELEHRTSKARFLRTNGRLIPPQLSKIERRQRHIRAIRENLHHLPGSETNLDLENVANDPQLQYNIGKTENTRRAAYRSASSFRCQCCATYGCGIVRTCQLYLIFSLYLGHMQDKWGTRFVRRFRIETVLVLQTDVGTVF